MKLLTVNLERSLPDVPPPTVGEQWVLVRLHNAPLGMLHFTTGGCRAAELARAITERFGKQILCHLTADRLSAAPGFAGSAGSAGSKDPAYTKNPEPGTENPEPRTGNPEPRTGNPEPRTGNPEPRTGNREPGTWNLEPECPQRSPYTHPTVTVAVCTRNGAERISQCLDALVAIDYPAERLDLLVVDNASSSSATARLIAERYPPVRCIPEPRPGLDWARNRAILEARGEIVAFTDDDVSVDPAWVDAIARVFTQEPEAECVTGLVVPDAIDTESHRLFEKYGGFGRGYERRYYRVNGAAGELVADRHAGAGKFGTGANMAFRRSLFDRIGMFDPALDVGTPTNGGGDLEMFFRVLKSGGVLVYEPCALVRHRHRQTYEQLRVQLANNGVGFYSYLVRSAQAYPEERRALMWTGTSWYYRWNVRRLAKALLRPGYFPRDLVVAEARGALAGLRRYTPARRVAREVLETHGPQSGSVS